MNKKQMLGKLKESKGIVLACHGKMSHLDRRSKEEITELYNKAKSLGFIVGV